MVAALRAAGCVAAEEEADELVSTARDADDLAALVARRCAGEPLAWITGRVRFCGVDVLVHTDVYVPRWQTERVASAAASALPAAGVAIDVCCGSGAVAAVLRRTNPGATVIATDSDPRAVACARANGVDARLGDLFAPVPPSMARAADVVVGVAPYVPTAALSTLARTPEPAISLDGGRDGLSVVSRIVAAAPQWLRPGGTLVLEIGRPQVKSTSDALLGHRFDSAAVLLDDDGDVCGVAARLSVSD